MSFNVPTKYNFIFEEVLTRERFYVSEVGTSLRAASMAALKKLVALNPKFAYTLKGVDYPRLDKMFNDYMNQSNAAHNVTPEMYQAMQNSRRYT